MDQYVEASILKLEDVMKNLLIFLLAFTFTVLSGFLLHVYGEEWPTCPKEDVVVKADGTPGPWIIVEKGSFSDHMKEAGYTRESLKEHAKEVAVELDPEACPVGQMLVGGRKVVNGRIYYRSIPVPMGDLDNPKSLNWKTKKQFDEEKAARAKARFKDKGI